MDTPENSMLPVSKVFGDGVIKIYEHVPPTKLHLHAKFQLRAFCSFCAKNCRHPINHPVSRLDVPRTSAIGETKAQFRHLLIIIQPRHLSNCCSPQQSFSLKQQNLPYFCYNITMEHTASILTEKSTHTRLLGIFLKL